MTLEESLRSHGIADPVSRAVLEYYLAERGGALTLPLMGSGGYGDGGGDGGYGYGGGGDGDGGGGDGDGDGDGGGDGGGGGYGDGGDGDGGYDDGGDGSKTVSAITNKGVENMNEGLHIISLPSGGFYPYTIVGWFRRLHGDEWQAEGARVIRRYGPNVSLSTLAEKGPQQGTELLPAAHKPRPCHRLLMGLPLECEPKAWAKDCPMPRGWEERKP